MPRASFLYFQALTDTPLKSGPRFSRPAARQVAAGWVVGMSGKRGMKSSKAVTLLRRQRPAGLRAYDGRSAVYRELRADYVAVADQRGGEGQLSPVERMLVEALVFANAWRRRIEEQAMKARTLDVARYVALVDRVHGISKTIGLKRAAKPVASLQQLMDGPK